MCIVAITRNSQKVETTEVLRTDEQISKMQYKPYNGILFSYKEKVLVHALTQMNFDYIMFYKRNHTQNDSFHINSEQENLQQQKVEWLLWMRNRQELEVASGYLVSFWGDENVLRLLVMIMVVVQLYTIITKNP